VHSSKSANDSGPSSSDDGLEHVARIEAQLLHPSGPFATELASVGGQPRRVFKARAPHLGAVLLASQRFGDAEYMVFRGAGEVRRFTYAEHRRLVASTASVLQSRYGVGPGDRVAILGENRPEWIVGFWATVSLGAIAVGLNGWWTGEEIRVGLADCEPKVLLADRKRLARINARELDVPILPMDDSFDAVWTAHKDAALPAPAIDPEDPALILYTSGTTGRAKGVVHMHVNVCSALCLSQFHGARLHALTTPPQTGAAPQPRILVTSPLFHVSGLHAAAIAGLAGGVTTVWLTGRFDAARALSAIAEERVTSWGYTATVLHRVLSHPALGEHDLSSMRVLGGGGSPITPELQARVRAAMPGAGASLGVGYGLTEATAFTALNFGPELALYPESVGRVLPTVEVEIRDPGGAALPEGEEGEIFVHGPLVMKGYFRDPQTTAEVLCPGGWLRTGDIGRLSAGRLFLASRKRDLILRGGENIHPAEVERRLLAHPDVDEAAVFGVDSEALGQEVKAVVVPKPGCQLDPDALSRWVGEGLAYYKVPVHWDLRRQPLPRNATGKVLKDVLRGDIAPRFVED
jgi:long-chain acyl-CoA synthetase